MNNKYRCLEDDLKGLKRLFRKCFTRNDNNIPAYRGQQVGRKHHDLGANIKSQLNGKGYDYHIEQGRDLTDILMGTAYQLGYDACYISKAEPYHFVMQAQGAIIHRDKDAKLALAKGQDMFEGLEVQDGRLVSIVDAMITMLDILERNNTVSGDAMLATTDLAEKFGKFIDHHNSKRGKLGLPIIELKTK